MNFSYIAKRFLIFLFVIWAAVTLIFFLPRFSTQNPIREKMNQEMLRGGYIQVGMQQMIEEYERKFGLDQPLWKQYGTYMWDMSRLDFGYSIAHYPKTVKSILVESLPWSMGLLGTTTIIAFSVGSLLGALLSWHRAPQALKYLFPPLLMISAVPFYLLGLVLIYLLAFANPWFPLFGGYTPGTIPDWVSLSFWGDVLRHSFLPALSMVLAGIGLWALTMRGMMVTVQGEDYMILAEAKGLKGTTIFFRYALRNSILPQVTSLVLAMGNIVGGAVLVEVVFGFPGIGTQLYHAIREFDYFVIYGIIFCVVLAIALGTFLLDVFYPRLDPRINYRRA